MFDKNSELSLSLSLCVCEWMNEQMGAGFPRLPFPLPFLPQKQFLNLENGGIYKLTTLRPYM